MQKSKRKIRARKIANKLREIFPNAKIALKYKTPWELLVAVVLSAQCTDKKVNEITERLFKKYRNLDDYASANIEKFAIDIKSSGFYRTKAKNIINAARIVKSRFRGRVPRSMNELLEIPGVARKSANVILGVVCGMVEGIAVDTHVRRFALKFDLTDSKDPLKIERDLMELLPRTEWRNITYRLIEYGRSVCPARKHECSKHPLTKIYTEAANRWPRAK